MKKKYKYPLLILILVIIIIIGLIIFKMFFTKSEVKNNVKVIDSIVDFSYTLDERDTTLMKDTYKELKRVLKEKDINYEEYASILARLFVIDLFTMDNKINKYDVACLEYVYPDNVDNFKTNVEDTIYKTIEDNTYGKRTEKLSVVSSVNVTDVSTNTFKINEEEVPSYVVTLNWDYENDLGYYAFLPPHPLTGCMD